MVRTKSVSLERVVYEFWGREFSFRSPAMFALALIVGMIFYSLVPLQAGVSHAPDWLLGILFGLGGIPGMYCGARLQKLLPQKHLKLVLGLLISVLAANYLRQYFQH